MSAIYEGHVRHRRFTEPEHEFRYRVFMVCLDLDDGHDAFAGSLLWSARRRSPVRFRRSDYLADPAGLVEERLGQRPAGPIRLLTGVRQLGVGFNPVSFYYCHEGERLHSVIAEVTNTPWGERHRYVLDGREAAGRVLTQSFSKAMHVSPLMEMRQRYELRLTEPGERLQVHIESQQDGRPAFEASLSLERREASPATLRRLLVTYPPQAIATLARIYGQALQLRLKGAPWYPHPARPA